MLAGAKVGVTISLSRAAPADGLTLSVSLSDSSIVASPVHVFVDAGATEVTFEIQGKRPGTVQLRTGIETDDGTPPESSMTMTATITVTGLYLSEIFAGQPAGRSDAQWVKLVNTSTVPIDLGGYRLAAGVGSYGAPGPVMPLLGIIMARSCAVTGGPYEGADNGAPAYQQMADFAPDLPAAGSAAELAAYALFDAAGPLDGKPIDAVGVGQQNGAALPGPYGAPLAPVAASIPDSQSLGRISASAWTLGAPSPSTCATF
jgi:hypothetical protein